MVEFFDVYLYTDRLTLYQAEFFDVYLYTHRLTGSSFLLVINTQTYGVEFLDDYLYTDLRGRVS